MFTLREVVDLFQQIAITWLLSLKQVEKDLITTDRKDLQKLKGRIQKYGESAYGNTE